MKLSAKMIAFFLVVVLVSAIGSAYTFYKIQQSIVSMDVVAKADLPRANKTAQMTANAIGQGNSVRGYMLFNKQSLLDDYKKLANENDQLETELIQMSRTEAGRKMIQEIKVLDDRFRKIFEKRVLPLKQAGKDQEALQLMAAELAPVTQALIAKAREYQDAQQKMITESMRQSVAAAGEAQPGAVAAAVIVAFLGIIIGLFAARTITKPVKTMLVYVEEMAAGDFRNKERQVSTKDEIGQLADALAKMRGNIHTLMKQVNESTEQVAASSEELTASAEQSAQAVTQVAGAINDIAQGAEKQLKAVDETSAVVEQMSAGIQQVAASANQVAGNSSQAAAMAIDGDKSVEKAVSQMANIEQTVNNSAQVVTKLGERSKEIGQIVDTISGDRRATNLLALNAAIEAARAGEQGRGFAVVAEEVRKLAEQSQDAAKQIAKLISEIQGDTDKAVVAMSEGTREVKVGTEVVTTAGRAFKEIATLVTQVSEQVKEISAAIQQMASGSQQIVSSVKEIDGLSKTALGEAQTVSAATEEQSASMEEIASSSQSLAKMAQDLQVAVSKFRV